MKIETSRTASTRQTSRKGKAGGPAGASFSFSGDASVQDAQEASAASAALSMSALLALQQTDGLEDAFSAEEREARRQALKRGGELVEGLDQIKKDLLLSREPGPQQLARLKQLLAHEREGFADPELARLMDAIETRAAVELAKRGLF